MIQNKIITINLCIAILCLLSCLHGQDLYKFTIGKGCTELPIEFKDMGASGILGIAVYGDSLYTIENLKIHILSLNGTNGRYIPINSEKGDKALGLNILSHDTIAIVLGHIKKRSVSVLLVSAQAGKVLKRINYNRETDFSDDQIVIQENQSNAYFGGKLFIPVTDLKNLANDPASLLEINIANNTCKLEKQSKFFKEGYTRTYTIASFCENIQMFTRITVKEYQIKIIKDIKEISLLIERTGEPLNLPFRLDCNSGIIWYWQITDNKTVTIRSLKLSE